MDGYTYTNIFDTKGIEYLVIIAFLLLLIPFWVLLNRKVTIKEQIQKAIGVLSLGILKIEQGIFYSRNHTWAFLEKSGVAKVGMDDLLLHITGKVNVRHLKTPGESIKKGELFAEVDHKGKRLQIFSPVSGTILDLNPALKENNTSLNDDPYGKGWLYTLKPTNWIAEIPSFYLAEEATNWLKKELDRYKDFLAVTRSKYSTESSMVVLQDGGELADNSLSELPEQIWQDFQHEFLNPE